MGTLLSGHLVGWCIFAILGGHTALLAYGAVIHSPARDEVAHLAAGLSHWELMKFDLYRVNPPLVRTLAAFPAHCSTAKRDWSNYLAGSFDRPEFRVGRDFINANGQQVFTLYTRGRLLCIPFSVMAGWVCYRWGRDLYGCSAGLAALLIWCMLPEVLANGQLITPDMGTTAAGLGFWYVFWKWLRSPGWLLAFLAGSLLGIMMLTKTTWLFVYPLLFVFTVAWCWGRTAAGRSSVGTRAAQLLTVLLLSAYLTNLGYLFEGSGTRLGDFSFISSTFSGRDDGRPGNRFQGSGLAGLPIPLPENFVRGIDAQKHEFERGYASYLRGEWRDRGWWYYYLYGLAVKTPVGLLALFAMAMFVPRRPSAHRRSDNVVLLVPAFYILSLVSSQTGFNHHMRYVLPALPYLVIFSSGVVTRRVRQQGEIPPARPADGKRELQVRQRLARRCFKPEGERHGLVCRIGALCVVWSFASSLMAFPHSHSFFNAIAGGPHSGHRHLLHSNVDWGQDVFLMRNWLRKQPEIVNLRYVPYCNYDFRLADPDAAWQPFHLSDPSDVVPGWYAISVNHLYRSDDRYRDFLRFEPTGFAGYSTRIYQVGPEDLQSLQ